MQLSEMKDLHQFECFICRRAGKDATLWPQIYSGDYSVNTGYGLFDVYINSKDPSLWSGHKRILLCTRHFELVREYWIHLAELDVNETRAWNDYTDRTGR